MSTQEKQGVCEGFCGLYSHHLITGLCPRCREDARMRNLRDEAHAQGAPLGDDQGVVDRVPHFFARQAV